MSCLGNRDAQELPSTCKKHTNVHQLTPFPALEIDKHCLNQRRRGRIDERRNQSSEATGGGSAGTPSEMTPDLGEANGEGGRTC
jgi:hypothetical protein